MLVIDLPGLKGAIGRNLKKGKKMAHNEHNHHDHYHGDHAHGEQNNGRLEHHHSVWNEILCHLPYAVFSVALCMIFLSFIPNLEVGYKKTSVAYRLFHNFHFLHLLFAGT